MNIEILGFIVLITVLNIFTGFKKSNILSCGLVGFSGQNEFDLLKVKFLLYWNSIERGTDATGIFTPEIGIVKDNSRAERFINNKTYIDKVKPSTTLVAHVRAKTFGANTAVNAHPFKYGRIIGAHNGSLKNHWSIAGDYKFNLANYDVDSQVLISAMNENFDTETPFKVLSEYEGAAALLFYDEVEDTLYACHDKERPLFYGYINDGKDMYISSIKDTLEVIECVDIKEFPVNTVHKIKDGVIIDTFKYEIYKPAFTEVDLKVATYLELDWDKDHKMSIKDSRCKGILYSVIRAYMCKGFWVNLNSMSGLTNNSFKHGNWYYVENYEQGNVASQDKLIVYDEKCEENELKLINIDCGNFIPVVDDYVALTYEITGKKKTNGEKKVLGKDGDICKIIRYKYNDETALLLNLETGKEVLVYSNCIRNLTYVERSEAITWHKKLVADEIKAQLLLHQPTMYPVPFVGTQIVNDAPLVDAESPFVEQLDDEDAPNDVEEEEEGYVSAKHYENVLLGTIEAVDSIELCLNENQTNKAKKEITELAGMLKMIFANLEEAVVA